MASCVIDNGSGFLVFDSAPVETCAGYIVVEPSELQTILQPIDFALLGITPAEILLVLTWGMGVVLMMWSLGYAVGVAKNLINKA